MDNLGEEAVGFLLLSDEGITYSPATLKLNKKYLKFFWVFPQITRVMRSLSIKNNCRNASKNEKITIF